MIDPTFGNRANAAVLVPIETSTPAAARAQSFGSSAVLTPARDIRECKMAASSTPGTMTNTGPLVRQLHTDGNTSEVGGKRSTPPPASNNFAVAGERGSG